MHRSLALKVRAFVGLLDGEILSRPFGFHQLIVPAAGLCARTPVGVPSGEIGGQETPSGKGHTHCSVDKDLQLHFCRDLRPDAGDLFQGQLPCQHGTFHAHVIQRPAGAVVDDARLCGHMDLHIRRKLSCHCQQSQVCQDERICAGILCLLQKLGEHGNLLVPWQGVAGEIYLFAVLVAPGQLPRAAARRCGNCWRQARILKLSRPR